MAENRRVSFFVASTALLVLMSSCRQSGSLKDERTDRPPSMYQYCEYYLTIFEKDGRSIHRIDFGCHGERGFADGFILEYDPVQCFVGYDTSLIEFDRLAVYPKSVGTTMVYLVYPPEAGEIVDSLQITVYRDGSSSGLVLKSKREY